MKYFIAKQETSDGWHGLRFYPTADVDQAKNSMDQSGSHSPGCANASAKVIEAAGTNGSSTIFAEVSTVMEDHESGCWRVVVTGHQGQFYPPVRFETYPEALKHISKTLHDIQYGKEIDENMNWARERLAREEMKVSRR